MATHELGDIRPVEDVMAAVPLSPHPPVPARAQRALTFGLLLSALRCTIQYVILPFVLPWIGVTASIPPWLTLALGMLALGALARNVRSLWQKQYAGRWNYLMLAAIVAISLLVFAAVDLRSLFHL